MQHSRTKTVIVCILTLAMVFSLVPVFNFEVAQAALSYTNLSTPAITTSMLGTAQTVSAVNGLATRRYEVTGHPYIAAISGTQGWASGGANWNSVDFRAAFDGSTSTYFDGYRNGHVQVEFREPQYIAQIQYRGRQDASRLNGAVLQGSNDGVNYDQLFVINGVSTSANTTRNISNGLVCNEKYKYVRIIDTGGVTADMLNIATLSFFTVNMGAPDVEIMNMINIPAPVYGSVNLIDSFMNFDVTWQSKTPDVMDDSGALVWQGAFPVSAVLTATLDWNGTLFSRDLNIVIEKPGQEIFAQIQLPPMIYTTMTINLPAKGAFGFDLIWESLTPDIMGTDGIVIWDGAYPVTAKLRASIEWPAGTTAASRDFEIVVMEEVTEFGFDTAVVEGMELLINLDFETNPVSNFYNDTVNGSRARTRSGSAATTTTAATLSWGQTPGSGRSARLSQNFHLELTKADGTPLLKGLDEFVVSYDVNPTGTNGNNLWAFVAKPSQQPPKTDAGGWEKYLGVRETTTSIEARAWFNIGRIRERPAANLAPVPAGWRHVDVHYQKDMTTIYFNGVEISSQPALFPPSEILTIAGGFAYIGYMPTGQYFTGEIDNFKIWKPTEAWDPDDAGKVAAAKEALIIPHDTADHPVYDNISLPDKGLYGADITWWTSHPDIVDLNRYEIENYDPMLPGFINRPKNADTIVNLRATITCGEATDTKDFRFTVKKALEKIPGPEDFEAYIYTHFTGDQNFHTDEQIYFAVSLDGVNWVDTRLRGDPVIQSYVGDHGLRDPWMFRSPEGDKFYLIATDLNIFQRYGAGGWGGDTGEMSVYLAVWESTDLVNWTDMRLVNVVGNLLGARNAWAPEVVYDELTGDFFVFFASRTAAETSNHMYYCRTRDFRTFTQAQRWITSANLTVIAGSNGNTSTIDATLIKQGNQWFRSARTGSTSPIDRSDDLRLTGRWTRLGNVESIWSNFNSRNGQLEGQEFLLYNKKDWRDPDTPLYGLFADRHTQMTGYVRLTTTDLASRSQEVWRDEGGIISDLTSSNVPSAQRPMKRHGNLMSITLEEYYRVLKAFTRGADHTVSIPDDYDLIAAFGFNHMANSGTAEFNDQTGNAKLVPGEGARWRRSTERAPGEVGGYAADFTAADDSWLNLTKRDGSALLLDENGAAYREVIITFNSRATDGDGWAFLASGNGQSIGIKDKPGALDVIRGNSGAAPVMSGSPSLAGNAWKNVVVYLGSNYTEVYVDGVRIAWLGGQLTLSQILGAGGGTISIGKEFQGQIDNLKIYALPLGAKQNQAPLPLEGNTAKVTPTAFVTKLSGNKNDLTITVVEAYSNGTRVEYKETIKIDNNAAGTYKVGPYSVYVDTKGNTQIREIYIK